MRRFLLVAVVLVCLIAAMPVASAASIWVSAKGVKQGMIAGGGTGGHAAEFAALGLDFSAAANVTPGPANGQVTYKPIRLYRALDAASVKLFQALAINEVVDPVVISIWGPTAAGTEQIKYQITLGKAHVSGIRYLTAYTPGAPSVEYATLGSVIEEVSLSFERIELQHPPSGAMAVDSVSTPPTEGAGRVRTGPLG